MELLEDLNRDYQRYRFTPRERSFLGLQGLQPVLSSNVAAVGVRNTELLIRFHNGSVYSYRGKADQYENILKSNSKGKWVWRNLRRKNAPYEKIGVIPLPDDIGVTDEDIFQEIDNRYLADLTRHVDVPVFQSFTFINGVNMQKIVVGNVNVYKAITKPLEVLEQINPIDPVADTQSFDDNGNELSQQQQAYFKDSKVRDENGNLIKLFHGSPNKDIKQFTTQFKGKRSGVAENLMYFTNDVKVAEHFSKEVTNQGLIMETYKTGEIGRVYEVYMDMKKPFDFRNLNEQELEFLAEMGAKSYNEDIELIKFQMSKTTNHQTLKLLVDNEMLKEAGYDGLIAEMYQRPDELEYGVFDSNQIKFVDDIDPTYVEPEIVEFDDDDEVDLDNIFDEDNF